MVRMICPRRLRIRTAESCSASVSEGRNRYQMCCGRVSAKLRSLLVGRSVTQDPKRGIARQDPDHAEDDDGHAEEHEGHQDEASADVGGATHISRLLEQPDG